MSSLSSVTEHDLRRMLDVVSPEAVASECPQMPVQVLRGLSELIPSSSVSFCVEDLDDIETPVADQDVDLREVAALDEEGLAMHARAFWDFPPCSRPDLLRAPHEASMWQDCFSDRAFDRTLMSAFYRVMGGFRHHLLLVLPSPGRRRRKVILWRDEGDPPFSERDRLLLTLLRPHLTELRDRIEAERRSPPPLTPRQTELLRLVARGHTNRRVARDLGLSEATVRKHLENIYGRLHAHSRTEALARAGLLDSWVDAT